ncbi:hypothetical protein TSAR_001327 [Trichomalopsis sarcophagae]|uniref:Uncharacterized protein n=1 Tax=Trichomalopsis sarcophagae TaxID=543379 RepID=A0A232F113_9HYME|nr:hypothetical protein TSAR_001327 [Trichomalopsis sarcophagae]
MCTAMESTNTNRSSSAMVAKKSSGSRKLNAVARALATAGTVSRQYRSGAGVYKNPREARVLYVILYNSKNDVENSKELTEKKNNFLVVTILMLDESNLPTEIIYNPFTDIIIAENVSDHNKLFLQKLNDMNNHFCTVIHLT